VRWLLPFWVLATAASAADISGIWIGQYEIRNGVKVDIAFQLVQQGTKLRGKLYGDYASSPIVDGIIAGKLITFVVETEEQAGNQINESRLRFTGNLLENGQLELIRERESARNAGNQGATLTRDSRYTMRLKRLVASGTGNH
jgi:hypothetical protein